MLFWEIKKRNNFMARQFQIVTDSSCDLKEEYYLSNGVERVNLGFSMNGVTYGGEEGEHISDEDFYAKLREGAMPTTFQITPEQARAHIEPFLKEGKDVFVLAFSSGLSGTANSFFLAARELSEEYPARKVLVVDSLCASLGEGLLLDYIVKKADTGASIEEIYAFAEGLKKQIVHNFTVDNLFHLKRGGRVSTATAFIGTVLGIKPVLHVNDEGHLIAVGKTMGRKKSISALVERMKKLAVLEENDPIFISHGDCIADVEYLVKLLKQSFGEREIYINHVGSVIGAHSGAGTVALFFKGKER